jgi:Fe-S cluster assembly iron-binding protein IscA
LSFSSRPTREIESDIIQGTEHDVFCPLTISGVGWEEMSLVKLNPATSQAVRSLLSEGGAQGPVRIELQFTGCCDPSLGLIVDRIRESDLVQEVDGLTFVIDPETHELAGEVEIAYKDEEGRRVFVLTSSKPVGEWDGLITCSIKM